MKIVHVMLWYIPGMGYQENFLPAEQKKLGHDVEIITSDRLPAFHGHQQMGSLFSNRIIGSGIYEENGVKIYRLPSLEKEVMLLLGLKKKLKALQPDVVHAHGTFVTTTLLTIIYSKRLNYKVFVDDHSHKNNFCIASTLGEVRIRMLSFFYQIYGKRVRCFLPVTHASKQILQSILKVPDTKIELLPLGANTNIFKKSEELRSIGRAEIGVNDTDFLIISSGKFDECKDIDILITAFENSVKINPSLKLLLVGSGPIDYMLKIKESVITLQLSDKVIFKDFAPNSHLPTYYNAADIGVWPGDHSITVIEAVASGLPTIVPENDIAYNILFENSSAEGFERGNTRNLSEKILKLGNKKKLLEMKVNCLHLSENILSWEKIAQESIRIYLSRD